MEKLKSFRITALHMEGFKSYSQPTDLSFGDPTVITGGNGRGKSSIADAIAFASCIGKGTPIGYPCPFFRKMLELVKQELPEGAKVFEYTH